MRYITKISVVALVSTLFIACQPNTKESVTDKLIDALKDDGKTVYIPSFGDISLWKDSLYVGPGGIFNPNLDKKTLTKTILDSMDLSIQTIDKLLESPYSNVQVYGYIYYVRNTNDLNYEYLKQVIPKKDSIFYRDRNSDISTTCYASDVMLLIAFKGVNYSHLLPMHKNYLYGLTDEQKHELYKIYKERGIISELLHEMIQDGYENDKTFLKQFIDE